MPLLTMVYVFGASTPDDADRIAHGARVAAELGADIVKVPYTGSVDSFRKVVAGCFAPVVIAGGERGGWRDVRATVVGAIEAGAVGVCIGRNVFQHEDPARAISELRELARPGRLSHVDWRGVA
jgi:DhnA family fructose-bisphosphate aldolase class Ia